jgi:hypothetical protein
MLEKKDKEYRSDANSKADPEQPHDATSPLVPR